MLIDPPSRPTSVRSVASGTRPDLAGCDRGRRLLDPAERSQPDAREPPGQRAQHDENGRGHGQLGEHQPPERVVHRVERQRDDEGAAERQ